MWVFKIFNVQMLLKFYYLKILVLPFNGHGTVL